MSRHTVQDVMQKAGVAREAAYGLMQFLVAKGLATKVGVTAREPGQKGAGQTIYEIDDARVREAVETALSK